MTFYRIHGHTRTAASDVRVPNSGIKFAVQCCSNHPFTNDCRATALKGFAVGGLSDALHFTLPSDYRKKIPPVSRLAYPLISEEGQKSQGCAPRTTICRSAVFYNLLCVADSSSWSHEHNFRSTHIITHIDFPARAS